MGQSAVQIVAVEIIERKIYLIRDCKVMLDRDLADLYEVPTKVLNQAVRRNLDRFPADFMFQLSDAELENCLRSQIVTSKVGRGGRRYPPFAFTEHGVAMLSSVLSSKRAGGVEYSDHPGICPLARVSGDPSGPGAEARRRGTHAT
jgi:hypothetical protein